MTTGTIPRDHLYLAQTPQVFKRDILIKAYAERGQVAGPITDDCQIVEAAGQKCAIVDGSPLNIKITTHLDLRLASVILPLLEKPKGGRPAHPFSDEGERWADLPKLKPSDLFGS